MLRLCRPLDSPVPCFVARKREVSGVVYVPGNMAASFRGRPIRSLRMRGKHEKLAPVSPTLLWYDENRFPQAPDGLGVFPHYALDVCF